MSHTGPPTPLERASKVWQGIFGGGPYTSLKMLQYIIETGKKTPKDFLKNPKTELLDITKSHISKQDADTFAITWRSKTGRCTSFAVNGVYTLSQEKDGDSDIYDFLIYDLGGHRMARCRKTGIVIDSSSTVRGGVFELPEGTGWVEPGNTSSKWKYTSERSEFVRDRTNPESRRKVAKEPIEAAPAMTICFGEVEAGAWSSTPTIFRSISEEGTGLFHGMIDWRFQARALDLVPDLKKKGTKIVIQWAQQKRNRKDQPTDELDQAMVGTKHTLDDCIHVMFQFVIQHGGPNGKEQWWEAAADGIGEFSNQLFALATQEWGYPKLSYVTKSEAK